MQTKFIKITNHHIPNKYLFHVSYNSPDGSCLNEVSIAHSIISQALPALSPRLNLTFSPKSSDRTRLVDSQSTPNLEMTIKGTSNTEIINESDKPETPKSDKKDSDKVQTVVTPNKWPLKPGVLVHVNSNHTLSPKNQAKLQQNRVQNDTENNNLGLLERSRNTDQNRTPLKIEYSKKTGKPRKHTQVVSEILKNLRRKSDSSDDDSGKYKKINKSNKRAVSLVLNKNYGPKRRIRSFFQSESPNVIVTEGGRSILDYIML